MWIEIDSANKNLKDPELDEEISFSDKGTAQVSNEIGKRLIEKYDVISESSKSTEKEYKSDKPEVKDIG